MGPGERQIEMDALKKQLIEHKLRVHQFAADGNCMYNSILHHLKLVGSELDFDETVTGYDLPQRILCAIELSILCLSSMRSTGIMRSSPSTASNCKTSSSVMDR